jgi:hypothetical protein
VDPEVLVVDGDAGVVAVVVDEDSIDVAVETPVGLELGPEPELEELEELEELPSAAEHILASPCRPAVTSEAMLLPDPHFEEEHWTAVFPPV